MPASKGSASRLSGRRGGNRVPAAVIDPVAFTLFGWWPVHWYGILWAVGFMLFYWLAIRYGGQVLGRNDVSRDVDALLFYGGVGALVGGRLGYVLFYGQGLYSDDLLEIFRIWNGGMSFHGGMIGVAAGVAYGARRRKLSLLRAADLVTLCAPLGVACGRIGNFINGELWGRPSEVPWAIVFERAGDQPRHPSQLYELGAEGLLLFALLMLILKMRAPPGTIAAGFLSLGALARFGVEYFREPDAHIGLLWLDLSMGQWLSLPTFALGAALAAVLVMRARRSPAIQPEPAAREARPARPVAKPTEHASEKQPENTPKKPADQQQSGKRTRHARGKKRRKGRHRR